MAAVRKLKDLEARLGYAFKDRALLKKALTHASVRQASAKRRDNERLEFLGDRVLGLAVAELLSELYPAANEGELARLYNRLVRGGTCAEVARSLDLGPSLVLSESEASSGGRDKETILADACEALLGAIFLEAGYDKAREVVRTHWGARLEGSPGEAADAKSALQEWAQGQGLDLPQYVEVAREGPDHAPRFTAEVRIKGKKPARGEGASKRAAEQAAATALLAREGVEPAPMSDPRARRPRRDALRLHRRHRRAQRRQVDARQRAGRRQGLDRQPQGADDAHAGARHRHRGHEPARVHRHARHLRAAPPARPGHGGRRLGRRRRCRSRRADGRCRQGRRRGRRAHPGEARRTSRRRRSWSSTRSIASRRSACWSWRPQFNARAAFAATFMISALNGDGVADLKAYLASRVPPGPWHYPEDEISDAPLRVLAAEITREKIYERLHDELPYEATVETTSWQEQQKSVRIEQTIYVERDSQKAIVLGNGGRTIKQMSMEARQELAAILEKPVHLFLFVKVRENWADDPERYRDMGLAFPKD